MTMTFRSLRVRLSLLSIVFMLASMSCLGLFSYWYLGRALASSRRQTMDKREARILAYINSWPRRDTSLTLEEKLRLLSTAIANRRHSGLRSPRSPALFLARTRHNQGWLAGPALSGTLLRRGFSRRTYHSYAESRCRARRAQGASVYFRNDGRAL